MIESAPIHLNAAQRRLVEDNIGLVGYTLTRYGACGVRDNDDAFQTGAIGLMRAAAHFDPGRGTKFTTFAVKCIRNELHHERRRQLSPHRGGGRPTMSLDFISAEMAEDGDHPSVMDTIDSGEQSIEDRVAEADFVADVRRLLADTRSRREEIARAYLLSTASQREIAELFGVTQANVSISVGKTVRRLIRRSGMAKEART